MKGNTFDFANFFNYVQHNPIALGILAILAFMSFLSWYLILSKSVQLAVLSWRAKRFKRFFWQAADLQAVIAELQRRGARDPFSRLTQRGLTAALSHDQVTAKGLANVCSHSEFVTRSLRHGIDDEREQLNTGLTILASIGSIAPFIGLLGTVIGIYSALMNISAQGQASLDTVSGPVGEALIMTAIGLAVAIPAVLFYNTLVRSNRHFLHRLETFANDLHAYLNMGIHIEAQSLSQFAQQSPEEKTAAVSKIPRHTEIKEVV